MNNDKTVIMRRKPAPLRHEFTPGYTLRSLISINQHGRLDIEFIKSICGSGSTERERKLYNKKTPRIADSVNIFH